MTNRPPSGGFPTGFSIATASICSGCDINWNGSGLLNTVATGTAWPGSNFPITGHGIGAYGSYIYGPQSVLSQPFGALTGFFPGLFPAGYLKLVYNRARDGACQAQTGAILYTGTSGTGVLVYTPATGCTGFSGCRTTLQAWFDPDSSYIMSPGNMYVTITDYCNGVFTGLAFGFPFYDNSGNLIPGNIPPGYVANAGWKLYEADLNMACGQNCAFDVATLYYPVLASGYGFAAGQTGWTIGCTPCTGS
jgi:hypothetical protein